MSTTKVIIRGRVQGVGFRYWLKGKFRELGIIGETWNNADGTVGAEFAASEPTAEKILEYCRQGPPLASVDKVVILK